MRVGCWGRSKREEVTEGWGKLHNEELPDIIGVTQ